MKHFYLTPCIFWEIDDLGHGRFVIAWLIIYLTFYFHLKKEGESE